MCGFAGFIDLKFQTSAEELRSLTVAMNNCLVHRGPDDAGTWVDSEVGIGLGHRRLSIIDISQEGHQPMHSSCARYVIVFNGEIYNYQEIRQELEGAGAALLWRGHSDTEVMLAAIVQWGLEGALGRFNGMFALALWDRQEQVLHLARDRIGEKPLYYGWMENVFLFGLELKALCAHPAWRGEINRNSLALLMRYNYVPAPHSIYENIFKLSPGTILSLPLAIADRIHSHSAKPYWSVREVAEQAVADPFAGTIQDAISELERLLADAVKLRMEADVPVGALLSGGIDSSIVVALMQAGARRPVKTFTIGFREENYDEAQQAKSVARHLGTDHTELYVTPQEAMSVIPKLPTLYDEPFSDSSQIPTFLVSSLARQQVTVGLSGDGGDELFGGYSRHSLVPFVWKKVGWAPRLLCQAMAVALTTISPVRWDAIFRLIGPFLSGSTNQRLPGDKLHKLARILPADSLEDMYHLSVSHWVNSKVVLNEGVEPVTVLTDRGQWADLPDFAHQMMFLDMLSSLPDDILVKVDRASMGVSLECRIPLLDHRIVEFAWRLPLSMRISDGQGKWLLRQVLYKYVPKVLVERPKMGFGVPIDSWLRGPLRDWAESLLNESRLRQENFFNPTPIRKKWQEHLSGKNNWQHDLWDVLMFQAWREKWG